MQQTINWSPHPGAQTKFHQCNAYEALFGGTKGPGKTDSILREGLRQIHKPNYRAIIFRRTYPNLREVIDRSFRYFPGMGAKYNDKEHRWTFESGAKFAFAHIQHEHDKYNYNGHEYHYIAFDQLEEFTEAQYLFIMVQNRTDDAGINCYMRSTANPGGVGHGWVKKRFIDCLKPYETKYFKREEDEDLECSANDPKAVSRAFIPANVYDNPSIMENDPNYIKRLEQLPEIEKQALLFGNWDVFKGQFFKQYRKSIHVKEKEILPEYLKFLSLDYGYANPSSVGWWMVDFDGNLHRYRELYKEGLTYSKLAEQVLELTPAQEKMDYCVADPAIWGDKTHHKEGIKGETGAETMQVIWKDFTALIKADNSRITGWGRMRELIAPMMDGSGQLYAKLTVDPSCRDFIRTVPILIHDDRNVEDIDSSGEDHAGDDCLIADTLITTDIGERKISDMRVKDKVLTRFGFKIVKAVFSKGFKETFKVKFSNGSHLIGTGNHPVFVEGKGFIDLVNLRYGDMMRTCITQTNIENRPVRFGMKISEKFQKGMKFITKILKTVTTKSETSIALQFENIKKFTLPAELKLNIGALAVGGSMNLFQRVGEDFAQIPVNQNIDEIMGPMIFKKNAHDVDSNLQTIGILNKGIAQENAAAQENTREQNQSIFASIVEKNFRQKTPERYGVPSFVESVTPDYPQEVFNLSVSDSEEYFANGVLVHNCRYAVMSRPEKPVTQRKTTYEEHCASFDPFSLPEPEEPEFVGGIEA